MKGTIAGVYAAISAASVGCLAAFGGPRFRIDSASAAGEAVGQGLFLFLTGCILAAIMWWFLRWQRALGHVREDYTQDDEWSFAVGGIAIVALAVLSGMAPQ